MCICLIYTCIILHVPVFLRAESHCSAATTSIPFLFGIGSRSMPSQSDESGGDTGAIVSLFFDTVDNVLDVGLARLSLVAE